MILTRFIHLKLARLRLQRTKLTNDQSTIAASVRRAMHELAIVNLDLRAAEERRKVAEGQLDRAAKGLPLSVFDSK
jgi:hypothetical protein